MAKESEIQASIKKEIENRLPGSIVMKTDPTYIQGIPDLLVLYKSKWASLEVKKDPKSNHQPNQDYYIDILGKMSFASFIDPTNREEVLNAMEQSLKS